MSSETKDFILIRNEDIPEGLSLQFTIARKRPDGVIVNIAFIEKAEHSYIKTIEDRFQNYVCTYDFYKEFIQLTDEAYDIILNETGSL